MAETNTTNGAAPEVPEHHFLRFLSRIGDGDLEVDAEEKLRKLLKEMTRISSRQIKASGGMTIQLTLVSDDRRGLEVDFDVKIKMPKRKHAKSTMWLDKHDNIVFESPRQQSLFGDEQPRAVREVSIQTNTREV